MEVEVVFTSVLNRITGRKEVKLEVRDKELDIKGLIDLLEEKYNNEFKDFVINKKTGKSKISFLVNGKAENLKYQIEDGDRIVLMNIMVGG